MLFLFWSLTNWFPKPKSFFVMKDIFIYGFPYKLVSMATIAAAQFTISD